MLSRPRRDGLALDSGRRGAEELFEIGGDAMLEDVGSLQRSRPMGLTLGRATRSRSRRVDSCMRAPRSFSRGSQNRVAAATRFCEPRLNGSHHRIHRFSSSQASA